MKVYLLRSLVNVIVRADLSYDLSDIGLISQSLEDVCNAVQLAVVRVIVPGKNWHSILWLKHVGDWRVVNNNDIGHLSAEAGHVLHIGVREPGAMFTEELVGAHLVRVDDIDKRVSVLRETSSEDDNLPVLVHPLQEFLDTRSNENKYVAYVPLNLNGENDVGVFNGLEGRVNKSLIKI